MPTIELETFIDAPVERCFDLARSIDLHKISTAGTNEEAFGGTTSGLIKGGEHVTWRARHFGITQTFTSKITAFTYPVHFRDEMLKGAFKSFRHDHIFESKDHGTTMRDVVRYESPGWVVGKIFNTIILTRYLRRLLIKRNTIIKAFAEDETKAISPGATLSL
jgi:ligand-binding SRPBCC domain-containing protein